MSATKSKISYSPLGEIQPKFNRLFLVICLLFAFGMLMMTSASIEIASSQYGDPFYFLKRQGFFSFLGFTVLMPIILHGSYNFFVSENLLIAKGIVLLQVFMAYRLKVMYDRNL